MKSKLNLFLFFGAAILSGCDDKVEVKPELATPTTYNFENVNYSGQTARLDMLGELEAEMKKGNTAGTAINAAVLKNMYANENAPFANAALNSSGKQLKDKTFSLDQPIFEIFFDKLAVASTSTTPGSTGVAGVVTSTDGTKTYLFDENGIEYTQVALKGLMGAVLYYQVVGHYLTEDKIGNAVDNTTVKEGEGTPMEHHWDEAFGYFGVPVNFPENKEGSRYFGRYSDQVNQAIGSNEAIMNAYIKGRDAIIKKDMTTKEAQAALLVEEWEKLVAACTILEINKAKASFSDDASRNHLLSEAIGFAMALKYNPKKKITQEQINTVLAKIGDNLYEVSLNELNEAIDIISNVYGFENVKNNIN
ncbi:MAG: DUF4856 domain-containing protein [Bacteroidota bacterium]|nr:DUF4856 domain-containing protein [Bacteroidota bacterium]